MQSPSLPGQPRALDIGRALYSVSALTLKTTLTIPPPNPPSKAPSPPKLTHPNQILTTAHLLLATTLSLHAFLHSRPKTRTPHAELVFRLSPNANIGESYKTFGIGPSSTALIAVKLPLRADRSLDPSVTRDTVAAHLGSVVEGESVPIGDEGEGLGALCEVHRVKKVYKIGCAKGKGGRKEGGQEKAKEDRRDVEAVVLGCMALKGQ